MPSRCPECNAEIDHLNYDADYTEYGSENGTCDLNGDDWDCSDRDSSETNHDGENRYYCPECDEEINPDNIERDNENEEEEHPLTNAFRAYPEESPEHQRQSTQLETDGGTREVNRAAREGRATMPTNNNQGMETKTCPECQTTNFMNGDTAIFCSNCNHEITI